MKQRLTSGSAIAIYALVAGILLANVLNLTGIFRNDPLLHRSALAPAAKPNIFPGDYTIDPNDGFTSQALGHLAADEWLHGHVPYWNHYEGVGAPLAGEMQSAALFPLVVLLALPGGLLYLHVLLELIAGISTFLLLKRLGRSDTAAAVGGLAFALSGTFSWLTNAVFNPIAFLPLLVLSVEIIRDRAQHRGRMGWALMAVALALSLSAGFPEVAFLDALFVAGWALLRLVQIPAGDRLRFLGKLAAGTLAGVALSAPILVAFLDYLAHANAGAHASDIGRGALPGIGVYTLLIPYLYGPIFGFHPFDPTNRLRVLWGSVGGFVTATAFGLGILALWGRRDRGLRVYLAAWALLVSLKTYGFQPVAKVINFIPGVTATAFYRYATVSVEFAVIVLGSFAIDDLLERGQRRRVVATAGALALAVVVYFVLKAQPMVRSLVGAAHHTTWAAVSAGWAVGTLLVLFCAGLLPVAWMRRCLVVGVVVVDGLAMFVVPQLSTTKVPPLDFGPVTFLQRHLGSQRFYSLGPLAPNYGSYFRVASVNVNDALLPKGWDSYISKNLDDHVNPMVFAGVDPANTVGPTARGELIDHIAAYAATGVAYVLEGRGATSTQELAKFGLKRVYSDALFEILELPGVAAYWHAGDGAQCTVGNQDVTHADVDCAAGGSLIRLEQYMPGWAATVDGHPVAVGRSGTVFQKIPIHAGRNTVVFTFVPPGISVAWLLCFLAIALLVGTTVLAQRSKS